MNLRNLILPVLFVLCLHGCHVIDDPIPAGFSLEVPRLRSEVVDAHAVKLTWHANLLCPGFNCPAWVDATFYDVFYRKLGEEVFELVATLEPDQKTWVVSGLEDGKVYEFLVRARRAGQETFTNSVESAPFSVGQSSTVFVLPDASYVFSPAASPLGDVLAYVADYPISQGANRPGQNLYLYDFQSGNHELIALNSFEPSWAASGDKLIYTTSRDLSPVGSPHYLPKHIEVYNSVSGERYKVLEGDYRTADPVFGDSDNTVYFSSDSLEQWENGIWKLDVVRGEKQLILPRIEGDFVGHVSYSELTFCPFRGRLAYNRPVINERARRLVYDVTGFETRDGYQEATWVESDGQDLLPVFNPFKEGWLAFISDRSGSNEVWVKQIDTGHRAQLTSFGQDFYIGFAGGKLSWGDGGEAIFVVGVNRDGDYEVKRVEVGSL
ncbi:PD40 domain-containing protein [Lunatimonas salinarum]|uniref:PD40 domain-containing protein n=1 Tax=Lunatimonas salinarum TaxID=1774590 RepID=UPI001ADFBCC5|nr:PD40 domain-containing protein [Lunatimonas salinarum]